MDAAMVRGLPKNFLGRKSLFVHEILSLIRMNALQRTKFSHQKGDILGQVEFVLNSLILLYHL